MQPLSSEVDSASSHLSPYLSLVLTAVVVMGSPGPATVGVTAVGAAFGIRRSMPYLAGIVAGTVAVLVVVAVGLGSVLATQPRLTSVLMSLAIAYILYLACRIATAPPLSAATSRRTAPRWAAGLVLAAANPKAYAAIATVVTGTSLGVPTLAAEMLVKSVILAAVIVVIHVAWLFAGACLTAALRSPRLSRLINITLALALLFSTIPAVTQLLSSSTSG